MSEKDTLVSLNPAQSNPYDAKPSDFPKSGGGQMAEGKNQLVRESEYEESPRHCQDDGPGSSGAGTPSNWGVGGTQFKVGTNSGESSSAPPKVSDPNAVDLVTGKIVISGYSATKVGEVGDPKASIPSK